MSLVSLNIYLHLISLLVQDCQWSDWGVWSKCTKECGSGGTQERKRETILPLVSILCVYVDETIERINGMSFITF